MTANSEESASTPKTQFNPDDAAAAANELQSNWIWDLIETPCESLGSTTTRSSSSQGNQDCIIETIFDNIVIVSPNKYFVEYGFNTPIQCSGSGPNTCRLYRDLHWKGLLLDAEHENHEIGLYQHALYSHNIVSLLKKYKVPKELDFLSSDMDSHDYFVLRAILESEYKPRVISVEYNSNWPLGWSIAMVDPILNHANATTFSQAATNCAWGASASSWEDLMHRHGYQLVAVTHMLDLFYVRNDLLQNVVVPSSPEYFDTNVDEPSFGSHLHHQAITTETLDAVLDQLVDTRIYEETKNLKLAKRMAANKIRTMIALGDPFTLQCFANVILPAEDNEEGSS